MSGQRRVPLPALRGGAIRLGERAVRQSTRHVRAGEGREENAGHRWGATPRGRRQGATLKGHPRTIAEDGAERVGRRGVVAEGQASRKQAGSETRRIAEKRKGEGGRGIVMECWIT